MNKNLGCLFSTQDDATYNFLFFFLFEKKKGGYLFQEKLNTPQLNLIPVLLRILCSPALLRERVVVSLI